MDRVYLDANVLFSAAYDPSSKISTIFRLDEVQLITPNYAASQALRNLDAKNPARLAELIELLRRIGFVADSFGHSLPPGIALPESDRPILQAAITAGATHPITGDTDFRPYFGRVIEGVLIMRPGDYLRFRSR